MPYKYLKDTATADTAFEAWGLSLEELIISSTDALVNLMVENIQEISPSEIKMFTVRETSIEMLLFQVLQDFIYYKDAEQLLIKTDALSLTFVDSYISCDIHAHGEKIDFTKHQLGVDVKAVTMHDYKVEKTASGWYASVIVDI